MNGMTVGELRELLEQYDDDTEVRVAIQPSYPLAVSIHGVAGPDGEYQDDDDDRPSWAAPDDYGDLDKVWIVTTSGVPGDEHPYASRTLWDLAQKGV